MTVLNRFDREYNLEELLKNLTQEKLAAALCGTLDAEWRIADNTGGVLRRSGGNPAKDIVSIPIRVELEDVGYLETDAPPAVARIAVAWLELVLANAHRYRMAADLHLEVATRDYETLQLKHKSLQESEARYKELSEQLEHRVKQQVEVIERAQRQLYQHEKLASVGSLAAGMAHEINNPLGFIRSNLSTGADYVSQIKQAMQAFQSGDHAAGSQLFKKYNLDFVLSDFDTLLYESGSGADRIAKIVANLKKYSAIDCAVDTDVDLNEAVQAATGIVAVQLPAAVKLNLDLQPLPKIKGDQSRLNQMLAAIVQNALQALEGSGVIYIVSRIEGNDIRIDVRDTGCGISAEHMDRIFDPFFTTREVGKGMGLGLSIARDIVMSHDGRIEVKSVPGKGTDCTVYLPQNRNIKERKSGQV
jgi:two-component system NtrC family sensor kinase